MIDAAAPAKPALKTKPEEKAAQKPAKTAAKPEPKPITKAEGKGSRPSLRSDRLANASDGEIAWIIKNGQMYKGMPSWGGLPEQQRWQIVTYLRCLNPFPAPSVSASAQGAQK